MRRLTWRHGVPLVVLVVVSAMALALSESALVQAVDLPGNDAQGELDANTGERFEEAGQSAKVLGIGSWAKRMKKRAQRISDDLEKSIRNAGEVSRHARDLLQCKIEVSRRGVPTLCIPGCTHSILGGFSDPIWRRMTRVLPVCFGKQSPCLPAFAHVILPAHLRSHIARCPQGCASGRWEAGAVCVPKGMEGLKIKGLNRAMRCPDCVPPCLTREMKRNIRYDPSVVNIPDCGRSRCSPKSLKLCMPPELRFIQSLQPLVKMIPLCGQCETACMPPEIDQRKLKLPFGLRFPRCPPSRNNRLCRRFGKPAMCAPASLKNVEMGVLQSLPKCGRCVKACLPKSVKKAFGMPDFFRIATCVEPRCKNKKMKGKQKPMLCVPKVMRFVPALRRLTRDRTLPICSSCEKMCHANYIQLRGIPDVFRQKLPHCDRTCKRRPKTEALCIPPALRKIQRVQELYSVPTCKKCQPACIPPEVRKELRGRLPRFIRLPTCMQPYGEDVRHATCMPPYLRLLSMPSLKELGLKACNARSKMCLPQFIKLRGLPLDLHRNIARCPRCSRRSRKPSAICIPKQLKQLGIVRRMRSLTKGMPNCPKCVEPCMPRRLGNQITRLASQVQFPQCHQRCRRTKRRFCIPRYLRYTKNRVVRQLQRTFKLKYCGACTDMCRPGWLKAPKLPFGLRVPVCRKKCGSRRKHAAMCLPRKLAKLRLPHSSKIQICPKCTPSCIPLALQRRLKLPKQVKIKECNKKKCRKPLKKQKQRLCVPRSMARTRLPKILEETLILCPVCTRSCVPKHMKPSLDGKFKPPYCPVDKSCARFTKALCYPDELRLVKDTGLHNMNLAPCGKCERPCRPKGLSVTLPFGMIFPDCPKHITLQPHHFKKLKKGKLPSVADVAAAAVKQAAVDQSMTNSKAELQGQTLEQQPSQKDVQQLKEMEKAAKVNEKTKFELTMAAARANKHSANGGSGASGSGVVDLRDGRVHGSAGYLASGDIEFYSKGHEEKKS